MSAMATGVAAGSNHPIDLEMRWNFGDSRNTPLSLDEFLAQKEADGVEFFAGKEPWLKGLHKLNFQTFFRVCTHEMDSCGSLHRRDWIPELSNPCSNCRVAGQLSAADEPRRVWSPCVPGQELTCV